MSQKNIITQVESLPELIRSQTLLLKDVVSETLSPKICRSIERVITVGCGDSHMASIATELAFEELSNIPTEPINSLSAARYNIPTLKIEDPSKTLVIGTSVSGTVVRTREALSIASELGMTTLAITANTDSPFANTSELTINCTVPDFIDFPGVRSYRISLVVLYLIAIRIAHAKHLITSGYANQLYQQIIDTSHAIESTFEKNIQITKDIAHQLKSEKHYIFVGHGPNYSTSLFGAAKLLEAAGTHAVAQDTEEWGHLEYFTNIDPSTPTFLISPGYRSHERALEMLIPMNRIGRNTICVFPEASKTTSNPHCNHLLPVSGKTPEIFTPLVYPVPLELFADHLASEIGESYFRDFAGLYDVNNLNPMNGNTIRTSQQITLSDIPKLKHR
tara:strand:- start:361 stop:1533 length:1173 start_codon:yes stop_codon:yes gene_type:complete